MIAMTTSSSINVNARFTCPSCVWTDGHSPHCRARLLTVEEILRLLAVSRRGQTLYGMTGRDRETLYLLALETGLRWSELASLTCGNFDLASTPPTVTVETGYSKRRREDTLPLRARTTDVLAQYLDSKAPEDKAFPMPRSKVGSKILREDLKAAGIPYTDGAGRFVDFHALRHSFITNLANSGVHPSTAQHLARHCDVNLTLSHYTHSTLGRQSDAVESLPDIAAPPEVAKATGTDGQNVFATCFAKQVGFDPTDPDESGRSGTLPSDAQEASRGSSTQQEEVVRAQGIEPWTYGLKVRCST